LSLILQDTFTGSSGAVTGHTPDVGGAYSYHASYSGSAFNLTGSGRLRLAAAAATESVVTNAATPSSPDYTVSVVCDPVAARVGEVYAALCARVDTAAQTHYRVQFNWDGTPGVLLYKVVAGTPTQLGSTHSFTPTVGVTFELSLSCTDDGADVDLVASLNGTPVVTVTDSSSPITAAGKAGLYLYAVNASDIGDAAGLLLDDFELDDPGAGGTPATAYAMTGPTRGPADDPSAVFTLTPDGNTSVTVTPADGGAGGTFTPSSLTWTGDAVAKTFTYENAAGGPYTISVTDSGTLTDPASIAYTAAATTTDTFTVDGGTEGNDVEVAVKNEDGTFFRDFTAAGVVDQGGGTFSVAGLLIPADRAGIIQWHDTDTDIYTSDDLDEPAAGGLGAGIINGGLVR
jgi:hypothetical protein